MACCGTVRDAKADKGSGKREKGEYVHVSRIG